MTRLYDHHDDTTLVQLVLTGEREAFNPLVDRYYPGILRLCVRLLGPITEAEDVAQDVMVQAYLSLAKLQIPENLGAWMHAIAANRCHSVLRRPQSISMDDWTGMQYLACRKPNAEEITTDRELHRTILEAIDDLSDINREVAIGFYLEGYSYQELEDLLDIPVDKVKSRLFKARQNLRKTLKPVIKDYIPEQPVMKEHTMKMPDHLEVEVEEMMEMYMANETIITFRVVDREQYVCLKLSLEESQTIESAFRKDNQATPITQNLSYHLLQQLGGQVDQVFIDHLVGQQCIARITIAQGSKKHNLDVRVGEAVALAVLADAPMYVTSAAIDNLGVSLSTAGKGTERQKGKFYTGGERRQHALHESIWHFMMDAKLGGVDEHTISNLKNKVWEELFPSHEITWEGQTVQAVEITYNNPNESSPRQSEKIWMLMSPYIWEHFEGMVKGLKDKRFPRQPVSIRKDPPLKNSLVKKVDQLISEAFQDLQVLGVPAIALISLNGNMLSGHTVEGPEPAERMGVSAVRRNRLNQYRTYLTSIPDCTGNGIYSRDRVAHFYWAFKFGEEPLNFSSEGSINGHWTLCLVGYAQANGNPQVHNLMQKLGGALGKILPDYSE